MTSRRLWGPLLVGLLVAGMLGVGGGGAVAVEPRTVTASIMIPAAAFIPESDDLDYRNSGHSFLLDPDSAGGYFKAPLSFPVPVVNIKRITLYAFDNDPVGDVCAHLRRSRPAAAGWDFVGIVCTVDSAAVPQTVYTTAIDHRQVNTAVHGSYLSVYLKGNSVKVYGVKINYSYNPGA